ncbi:hypothetical protein LCGC14_1819830 [marine sediment metagenome]|uniref:Uncharacterized protein n=1 Tax=marine sediment metagenome TaxID=412755 RepID=A0A0F9GJ94_9ZZZZ|nr:hypothetical protein [Pricia sp.]
MDVETKVFMKTDSTYIYEKDGETIYRRKFMDYNNREEISVETMEASAVTQKETHHQVALKQKKIWEHCEKLSVESTKMQQGWFKQW